MCVMGVMIFLCKLLAPYVAALHNDESMAMETHTHICTSTEQGVRPHVQFGSPCVRTSSVEFQFLLRDVLCLQRLIQL